VRRLRGLAGFAQILGVDSTSCGSRRAGAREPTPAMELARVPRRLRMNGDPVVEEFHGCRVGTL
jgi:hypothetical protein